jgi:hypothetical protein
VYLAATAAFSGTSFFQIRTVRHQFAPGIHQFLDGITPRLWSTDGGTSWSTVLAGKVLGSVILPCSLSNSKVLIMI